MAKGQPESILKLSGRLLWENAPDVYGRVTADGRLMSFVDWDSHGNVGLHDFVSGKSRRVTNSVTYPLSKSAATHTALSRDGKQIAYLWRRDGGSDGITHELRIVGADGSLDRLMLRGAPKQYFEPVTWLPDNRRVAIVDYGDGRNLPEGLLLIDTNTGESLRRLSGQAVWPSFSPDGRWFAYSGQGKQSGLFVGATNGSERPRQLATLEDNDSVVGWSPDGGQVVLLSRRNGSAGFRAQPIAQGRSSGSMELLRDGLVLPERMFAIGFLSSGAFVYGERDRRLQTFTAHIDPINGALKDAFKLLPSEAPQTFGGRWDKDGKLFFVRAGDAFVLKNSVSYTGWTVRPQMKSIARFCEWAPRGEILIYGQGIDGVRGFYLMDATSGQVRLAAKSGAHPNRAFGAMSPDGKTLYYSGGIDPEYKALFARDLSNGSERMFHDAPDRPISVGVSPDGRIVSIALKKELRSIDATTAQLMQTYAVEGEKAVFAHHTWLRDGSAVVVETWEDGEFAKGTVLTKIAVVDGARTRTRLAFDTRGFDLSPDGLMVAVTNLRDVNRVWLIDDIFPRTAK